MTRHSSRTGNSALLRLDTLEALPLELLRVAVLEECALGARPLLLVALPAVEGRLRLLVVLADDSSAELVLLASEPVPSDASWPALTLHVPAFHMLERELFEDHGIVPLGHPWLKPVRKTAGYGFFRMEGAQVHEVAVGPVHAGVIEPGHFRFMCTGEDVHHLEISLGYQHRGVEGLMEKTGRERGPGGLHLLAESIAGDSVAAHGCASAAVLEGLAGVELPATAATMRVLALELERAAMHAADLSALAGDVAFLLGSSVYGANRTLIINSTLDLCGSRFARGLIRAGGCVHGLDAVRASAMAEVLAQVHHTTEMVGKVMFSAASVTSRFERTGTVTRQQAAEAGLCGLAARASGLALDCRHSHPLWDYRSIHPGRFTIENGDVAARAELRRLELADSLNLAIAILKNHDLVQAAPVQLEGLAPDSVCISLVEGWRGEVVHCCVTDPAGRILRYKVKDPSLNNWFGLALAVREDGISDFPLCNKSFDLSYCGNDL